MCVHRQIHWHKLGSHNKKCTHKLGQLIYQIILYVQRKICKRQKETGEQKKNGELEKKHAAHYHITEQREHTQPQKAWKF